jgi:D-serine deaminase-like pyridoxal phosphate-dependent protein
MILICIAVLSSNVAKFSWRAHRQNILIAATTNKTHECYSFVEMLKERHISQMTVGTQKNGESIKVSVK